MRTFLTFLCFILITACSHSQVSVPPQPVADRSSLAFWTNETKQLDVIQQVVGSWKDERFSMQTRIAIRENHLKLVMLDHLGRRAMTANWDQDGITTWKANWLPDYFNAEYMMWDIVSSYWPKEFLNEIYGADWKVEDIGNKRILSYEGNDVAQVTYEMFNSEDRLWNSSVRYENLYFGYVLDIQSREVRP